MDYAIEAYGTVAVLDHEKIRTKTGNVRKIRNFYRFLRLYPATVEIKKIVSRRKGRFRIW
jgi:hypothetical protein